MANVGGPSVIKKRYEFNLICPNESTIHLRKEKSILSIPAKSEERVVGSILARESFEGHGRKFCCV